MGFFTNISNSFIKLFQIISIYILNLDSYSVSQNTHLNPSVKMIIAYIEGTISSSDFVNELYNNQDLEKLLSEPIHIAPYIDKVGTLYLYLLSLNFNNTGDILNATHTLSLSLTKKGYLLSKQKQQKVILIYI